MAATVSCLQFAPVKGLALHAPPTLDLVAGGVAGDRRFVIVTAEGRALYGADLAALAGAASDHADGVLELRFADGEVIDAPIATGEAVHGRAYADRPVPGRLVIGPFGAALSERLGRPVRLIEVEPGRGTPGPLTVIADSSVARVAEEVGVTALDPRRFRMNVALAGLDAHAEDAWDGREVRIGAAVVRIQGQVPRCVLTTRDPDTARRDHDVLRAILAYRMPMAGGEAPLGMYGYVVQPGRVYLGDAVEPT